MTISGLRRVSIQVIAIAMFIFLLGTSLRAEDQEGLQEDDVPVAVLSKFKMDSAVADIDEIYVDEEGEHPLYEFWINDWNKAFIYQEDGTQYAIKEDIKPRLLPEQVRAVVKEVYPRGRIAYAYTVLKGSDTEYEVVFGTSKKDVLRASDGTPVTIGWEEQDEDDEDETGSDEGQ